MRPLFKDGDEWVVRGVRPVYRRAARYLRRAEGLTIGGVMNRALRAYLREHYPEVLARAQQDEAEGRPASGYRVGPAHREDDNDME